jgi:hypothetical protein
VKLDQIIPVVHNQDSGKKTIEIIHKNIKVDYTVEGEVNWGVGGQYSVADQGCSSYRGDINHWIRIRNTGDFGPDRSQQSRFRQENHREHRL